jgi:DNA-binding NarL/FixJ family response regulator
MGGFPHINVETGFSRGNTYPMGLASVLIVEDDLFSRAMIESVLKASAFDTFSTSNASSALANFDAINPNCALLDIDLGLGPTGIDLAHALRERKPAIGIVFLTSYIDFRLSRAGDLKLPIGSRYLTKSAIGDAGKLTTTLMSASVNPLSKTSGAIVRLPLSQYQIQVMRLVASGYTNAEIARQMEISEKAIEHVLSRILQKIGVVREAKLNPRVQLVQAYSELSGKPVPR